VTLNEELNDRLETEESEKKRDAYKEALTYLNQELREGQMDL